MRMVRAAASWPARSLQRCAKKFSRQDAKLAKFGILKFQNLFLGVFASWRELSPYPEDTQRLDNTEHGARQWLHSCAIETGSAAAASAWSSCSSIWSSCSQ